MKEQESKQIGLERLESPERKRMLPPGSLLELLEIRQKDCVLDLGAGGGYFALPAAQHTENKVYAVDNDPFMLDILRDRIRSSGFSHVEAIEGGAERIPLATASVDAAIASLILHILDNPALGVKEMCRVLKPGGRGLIVEWLQPRADGKPGHRISPHAVRQYLQEQGMAIDSVGHWADTYYSIIFHKP